jgi:hypothetical protein
MRLVRRLFSTDVKCNKIYLYRRNKMKKTIISKIVTVLTLATLAAATLLSPLQASAQGKFNCGWVITASNPATGSYTYVWHCAGKGA